MADVTAALSAEQLSKLRTAYQRPVMHAVATQVVAGPWPAIGGVVKYAAERFYNDDPPVLGHANRERCLIMLFAADRRPTFAQAVHIYWGLMEGLEIAEIAEIISLGALYGGLDAFTDGIRVLQQTLALLAAAADEGGEGIASGKLLPKLVAAFR